MLSLTQGIFWLGVFFIGIGGIMVGICGLVLFITGSKP